MIAAIGSPFALFQEPVAALLFDAVEATQVTLGLISEVLDPIDVIVSSHEGPCRRMVLAKTASLQKFRSDIQD